MFQGKIHKGGPLLPQVSHPNEDYSFTAKEELYQCIWWNDEWKGVSENLLFLFFNYQSCAVYKNFKKLWSWRPSEDVKWKLGFRFFLSSSFPPLSLPFHSSFSPPSYHLPSHLRLFFLFLSLQAQTVEFFEQHGNISSNAASLEKVLKSFSKPAQWNQLAPVNYLLMVADSLLIKKGQHI